MQNKINFKINDASRNTGESAEYTVKIDATYLNESVDTTGNSECCINIGDDR